ncbi:PREDICTED: EF-hand calcium-binding domain-containing protein 1-like [Nicrophorus vespilloides]|uniref:EF-hand calcium-binding domain-containing protein 1-like n=1 Tax=Nicrophorus vespilloides TaxID=110193 RepID=A0ABM1MWZ7_NICVS|nr:PREDICTED: EF-hand calcium-binding domain-containing protein 1-like [Nicrophorus vespilloides]
MSYGMTLDLSMDPMEETRIKKKYYRLIKDLTKKHHFNQMEIESLILIFHKIRKDGDMKLPGITKNQFLDVLHNGFDMTDDALMDRIFTALETAGTVHPTMISMETWTSAMSLFIKGTLDEKIDHCFAVYNLMGDGMLGRDSMFHLLKKSLISSGSDDDAEESVKDMIEIITKKMDLDRDGKISYSDFKQTVTTQPMLLESFGQCLPSRMAVHAFASTIFAEPGKL